jgi:hypothetical protein
MRSIGLALTLTVALAGTGEARTPAKQPVPLREISATVKAVQVRLAQVKAPLQRRLGGVRIPSNRSWGDSSVVVGTVRQALTAAAKKRWIPKAGLRTNLPRLVGRRDKSVIGRHERKYATSQITPAAQPLVEAVVALARMPAAERRAQIERDIPKPPPKRQEPRSERVLLSVPGGPQLKLPANSQAVEVFITGALAKLGYNPYRD